MTARRGWWAALGAMLLALGLSWLPVVGLPLGDNHEGRILARLGMQAANFWRLGPTASHWATLQAPYDVNAIYAHHPPLVNLVHVSLAGITGADRAWELRVPGLLLGLATVVAVAALLRALRLGWGPTLLAVAAMAATPMFWLYGRVGGGFSLLAALAAAIVWMRRAPHPGGWAVAGTAIMAGATVLLSWPAALGAGLLWVWLGTGRRWDRATWWVAAGGVGGALLLGAWLGAVGAFPDLWAAAAQRVTGGDFGAADFVERQWWFATRLLPGWYLLLAVPALVAGLVDRRTRAVTAISLGLAALWMVLPNEGSFVHDFWNLHWLLPVAVGTGALADRLGTLLPERLRRPALLGAALLVAVAFAMVLTGPWRHLYLEEPAAAGGLLESARPEAKQRYVPVAEDVALPRWVSWAWSLPVFVVTPGNLEWVDPDLEVLVNTDELDRWVGEPEAVHLAVSQGRYALVNAGELQRAARP